MLKSLSEALEARGFDTLTPVQEAVSAEELINEDLLVSAQTGSGKTVGFGIAIAPTLLGDKDRMPRAGYADGACRGSDTGTGVSGHAGTALAL